MSFWEDRWYRGAHRWASAPLSAAAAIFGAASSLRRISPVTIDGARVISIGNLNVGGTGKTPAVIYLALAAVNAGQRVGVLSRGYGRSSAAPCDFEAGALPAAELCGDEPRLIASRCPGVRVFVNADRVAAARAAVAAGFSTLLLDDGFQHRRLARQLDVLVVDAEVGFGNGQLLPAGPLREPLAAISRAGLIWLVNAGHPNPTPLPAWPCPVVQVRPRPLDVVDAAGRPTPLEALRGVSAIALTGIARPERFLSLLKEAGVEVAEVSAHADHAVFPAAVLDRLRRRGLAVLTTEKDLQRLPTDFPARAVRIEHQIIQGAEHLSLV